MGNLFQLDEWFSNVTPFGHVSQLPVDEFEVVPFFGLIGVAIGSCSRWTYVLLETRYSRVIHMDIGGRD